MTTAKELARELIAFKVEMGTARPHVCAFLDSDGSDKPIRASVHANWPMSECEFVVEVDQWSDLVPTLRERWASHRAKYNAELVRKIALAIIEITAVNGECTDAALRGNYRFSNEEVTRFGADAVEKANAMAANGPFSIVSLKGANAA